MDEIQSEVTVGCQPGGKGHGQWSSMLEQSKKST